MIRNGFVFALALLLAGCAALRTQNIPDKELERRQVIELINYAQRVAAMTPEQQRREYSASNQAFAKGKDTNSRIQLALLLATPGASVHDATRAASLLEPVATAGDTASPLRALARLLYAQLNECANEQKRANQMRDQLDAAKESERSMREKLEALKDIERSILQRAPESQPRHR